MTYDRVSEHMPSRYTLEQVPPGTTIRFDTYYFARVVEHEEQRWRPGEVYVKILRPPRRNETPPLLWWMPLSRIDEIGEHLVPDAVYTMLLGLDPHRDLV